ncbi:MAG: hypothetical protein QM739_08395 [Propionivibrio sp.]
MKQFALGKSKKARVWIDELPDTIDTLGTACEITMSGTRESMLAMQAAVEVLVPLGPRSMYGLLGGRFTPSANGQLTVKIFSSSVVGKSFPSSLASAGDQVWTGLPIEYSEAVKEGIHLVEQDIGVVSGELIINCAAYGEIGSCYAIFKSLAIVLTKLISEQKSNLTDDEIVALFPATFA